MNKFMPAEIRLFVETIPDTDQKQITVEVANNLDTPIESVSVTWHYDHDDLVENNPNPMNAEIEFLGCYEGALPSDARRQFVFPKEQMPLLLSVVASLSSERHGVVIRCDDETERIDGQAFGGLIEEHFG